VISFPRKDRKFLVRVAWEYVHRLVAVAALSLGIASIFSGLDAIVLKGDSPEGSNRRSAITIAWLCILGAVALALELRRRRIKGGGSGEEATVLLSGGAELLMKQCLGLCVLCLLGLFIGDRLAEEPTAKTLDGCALQVGRSVGRSVGLFVCLSIG
jgi:hypothetical protein